MVPDTGERYLSTPLFADVPADMTEDELEIARSTPGQRFDVPATPVPATAEAPLTGDAAARAYVEDALGDAAQPVVLFALEWCEFCWSMRRLFARLGIPFRSVDLDSVALQQDDLGGRIRAAVAARTGVTTIPQLFVGGRFVGGCTETFDAWREGRLQQLLAESAVEYDREADVDPYTFLPGWLQSR
jgi:cysteine synthase A